MYSYQYSTPSFFTSSYFTQHFNCDGYYNGKQSWISDDTTVKIIWDTTLVAWKLSGDTLGTTKIINKNPQQPPINGNWSVLGQPYSVTANQGECIPVSALKATANVNNPSCSCDGTISITATGGVPPYEFSINGGTTFVNSPLFVNLCGGLISWVVKDSVGTIFNGTSTLTQPIEPTTYNVTGDSTKKELISQTQTSISEKITYGITSNPVLPNGATITADLELPIVFQVAPYPNSYVYTVNVTIVKNGVNISQTSQTTNTTKSPMGGTCSATNNFYYYQEVVTKFDNFTFTSSDVITIEMIYTLTNNCSNGTPEVNSLYELGPLSYGKSASTIYANCCNGSVNTYRFYLRNIQISGCNCCNVTSWNYFYNRS